MIRRINILLFVITVLKKYYYNYREAQKDYDNKLRYSRIGIDMSIDEVEYWNDYFKDKIKDKNQPILHIFKNIENEFPKSIQTFYKYVHKGYFSSINDEMLSRSFSYKPRNKKETVKTISKDNIIKKGRKYNDFQEFIKNNPNANIVEMDTVEGKKGGKVLLTLHFVNCSFMLAFLRNHNDAQSVIDIFNLLQEILGIDKFKELFVIILTDNGSEFSNPKEIEFDPISGEKRTQIFYCHPSCPNEKGSCEVNHELIRRILPKGTSFDELTQDDINLIMSHINSYKRKKLNNVSPITLFNTIYGNNTLDKLNIREIDPNDINLTSNILK